MKTSVVKLAGIDVELFEAGAGAALLWLHGGNGFDPAQPFVAPFAERRRLIVPSHPGFGKSGLPDWLDRPDDIAILYLELLDWLGLARAEILGCSIGGWIAAELASLAPERVAKLVLVGPVGVKVGPGDKLDIPDIWALPQEDVNKLLFHDPARMQIDPAKCSDEQLTLMLRNRESLALLTWEPWMHNPKLKHRLHRIASPALFVRGASDGLVSAGYLEAYAKLVPGARTVTIAAAGHAPHLEQPAAFATAALSFLDAGSAR